MTKKRKMIAKLEFPIPEFQYEFDTANKALEFKAAICEFNNWLRGQIKHCDEPADARKIREQLWEILNDRELNLD